MTNRIVPGSPDSGKLHPYNHRGAADDIVVDLIRPRDLVGLTVTVRGAVLEPPADPGAALSDPASQSTIVAGADARLFVDFPFQHAHEQVSFEAAAAPQADPMNPEKPGPAATNVVVAAFTPAEHRPARGSRLVFRLAEGARVTYSTAGLLGALPWLDAVLHPLGEAPGTRPPRYQLPGGPRREFVPGLEIFIGAGLVARIGNEGVEIAPRAAAAGAGVPDGSSLLGRAQLAVNTRIVAEAIAHRGASLARGVSLEQVGAAIGEILAPQVPPIVFRRGTYSRKATLDETSIEAPFRLQLSPTVQGHWLHAPDSVAADDAAGHVELWHTRLDTGVRTPENVGHPGRIADDDTRVVRAIWTRDRDDLVPAEWKKFDADQGGHPLGPDVVGGPADPFLGPLDRADRHRLVRQSAETWPGEGRGLIAPVPVGADKLWLTSLGAWMEFHGQWTTGPYSKQLIASILAWDHIATGGRDQYVRVVYPGYLYPLGQPTVLVKLTERSIRPKTNPTAGLFMRQFLVVIDPVRTHGQHGLPFTRTTLRPLVTPNIDPPASGALPGITSDKAFWPKVGGVPFAFRVDAKDRDNRDAAFPAPLIWVAEHVGLKADLDAIDKHYANSPLRVIDLKGQSIAFAPKDEQGDALIETQRVRLIGTAAQGRSTPALSTADVVLPAAQAIAGSGPTTITYFADYRKDGFSGSNPGRVWAATLIDDVANSAQYKPFLGGAGAPDVSKPLPKIGFGGNPGDVGSDKAGGFLQPNLTIAGLSTLQGPVGDLATVAKGDFDPKALLGDALPKLFGLVPLTEILPDLGPLDDAPALVTDALDAVTSLIKEVDRAKQLAQDAVAEAQRAVQGLIDKAVDAASAQIAAAEQLVADAQALVQAFIDLGASLPGLIDALVGLDGDAVEAAINLPPGGIRPRIATAISATRALARPPLPLFARTRLEQLAAGLGELAEGAELAGDLVAFLNGLDLDKLEITFRYDWKPVLTPWPSAALPLLDLKPDSLVLAVRGTIKAGGAPKVEVLAELRDFALNLFSKDPLMRIPFDHISFKAGSTGKAEVDVLIKDVVFGGFLSFVEVIKDLIPLDGFSDPPFVDVTPAGLSAGFTLTLPNVAVGVFNLSNMSLGADVQVPFLGEALSVGFNFCTREKPFVLSVVFLGGGGWFLIRLSPKGLEILELGLEAGAYLAVDFGVASGSISAAIGVYIRLEGEKGSLTGYFRLRGEVDVLGLISASIELYMELVYQFDTGKMLGRARITVEVEVLCFSASVTIEAERQFAGSNGDPSLREVVMEPDGSAPAWDDYLMAFATEEVPA